jgi:4-hydroxy-tetrahydrodipicolinate synthase
MNLHGIIPPLVTPMHADESVDLDGLRRHIDWLLGHRVHGLFVLGTTGEFYALDDAEKQAVVAATVAHANGRSPVFVGTGAESTREVLRLTAMAEREKAQGVSIITPYFIKPTQVELYDHYRRVAESTRLPVVLYSNPGTCGGLAIEPETVAKLAEIKNIIGIKDSSGNLENLLEMLQLVPKSFGVLMGRDTLMYAALQHGAAGAIPATCNVAPEFCVGIYEAFQRGDHAAAKAFQDRLHPVRTALSLGTSNGAVKEGLSLRGRDAGPNRRPIAPLNAEKRAKLKAVLAAAGLLK